MKAMLLLLCSFITVIEASLNVKKVFRNIVYTKMFTQLCCNEEVEEEKVKEISKSTIRIFFQGNMFLFTSNVIGLYLR